MVQSPPAPVRYHRLLYDSPARPAGLRSLRVKLLHDLRVKLDVYAHARLPGARPARCSLIGYDAPPVICPDPARWWPPVSRACSVTRPKRSEWRGLSVTPGVELHLVDKGWLVDIASADGLLIYGVTALVDAREVRKLRERVRDAMQHIADTGRFPCSTVYGYTRQDKRLVVVQSEAAIIREATARLLNGETARAVALDLEQRGVPTKRGGAWTSTNLLGILRNPVLTGRFQWRGVVLPGDHEPILTDEEQSAVIALSVRRWKSGRRTVRFLSSLFTCGVCGGRTGTRNSRRWVRWSSAWNCTVAGGCGWCTGAMLRSLRGWSVRARDKNSTESRSRAPGVGYLQSLRPAAALSRRMRMVTVSLVMSVANPRACFAARVKSIIAEPGLPVPAVA